MTSWSTFSGESSSWLSLRKHSVFFRNFSGGVVVCHSSRRSRDGGRGGSGSARDGVGDGDGDGVGRGGVEIERAIARGRRSIDRCTDRYIDRSIRRGRGSNRIVSSFILSPFGAFEDSIRERSIVDDRPPAADGARAASRTETRGREIEARARCAPRRGPARR